MSKKNQVKTESVTSLSISAINKAESLLNSIPKVLEDFNKIKSEVETIKLDLNLGLAKYEAEINEKKANLDETLNSRTSDINENIKAQEANFKSVVAQLKKEQEEVIYNHKLAIERDNLDTARIIANKNGLILLPSNTEDNNRLEIESLEKKHKADLAITVNSAVKNAKEELNETIRSKETHITILNNDLVNANEKVNTLKAEIAYLKEQLDSERKASIERLAAAKVSVQQTNQGK